jgi:hypothetical protein
VTVLPLAVVVGADGVGFEDVEVGAFGGRGTVRTVVPPEARGVELTRDGALVVGGVVLGAPVVGTS